MCASEREEREGDQRRRRGGHNKRQINRGDGVTVKILLLRKKIQKGNPHNHPNEREGVAALRDRSTEERRWPHLARMATLIFFGFLFFFFFLLCFENACKIFFLFRNGKKFTKQIYFVASINNTFQI